MLHSHRKWFGFRLELGRWFFKMIRGWDHSPRKQVDGGIMWYRYLCEWRLYTWTRIVQTWELHKETDIYNILLLKADKIYCSLRNIEQVEIIFVEILWLHLGVVTCFFTTFSVSEVIHIWTRVERVVFSIKIKTMEHNRMSLGSERMFARTVRTQSAYRLKRVASDIDLQKCRCHCTCDQGMYSPVSSSMTELIPR